jgi:hypothetical protein
MLVTHHTYLGYVIGQLYIEMQFLPLETIVLLLYSTYWRDLNNMTTVLHHIPFSHLLRSFS